MSWLSAEQKEKEIIEIDETIDEKLVAFLKKMTFTAAKPDDVNLSAEAMNS